MTEIFLMETLAAFVEEHTKDIILEVETEPGADRKERPAEVHKYGLPKKDDKIKRIPYVLLQLLKGEDEVEDSECMIRIIAATYSEDWDAGEYDVLNLILRIKAELKRVGILDDRFVLHFPVEYLIYTDTEKYGPYHFGEMITKWGLPPRTPPGRAGSRRGYGYHHGGGGAAERAPGRPGRAPGGGSGKAGVRGAAASPWAAENQQNF